MAKMYTLDEKLLVGVPEIRIKDKVYTVDDREKTVKKVMKLQKDTSEADGSIESIGEVLKLGLGEKSYKEIDAMNLPWAAYNKLLELVIAAMTGQDAEDVSERFQEQAKKSK